MKISSRKGLILLTGLLIVYGFRNNFVSVAQWLQPPAVYWKDCTQPWLMGKALRNGVSPYGPLPELGRAFLPETRFSNHPTPYPPLVALLGVPMSMLPFESAAWVWFAGELVCVMGALLLLLEGVGARIDGAGLAVLFGVLLVSGPVSNELRQGQFMAPLLLLLAAAWRSLRAGRDIQGGAWLGLLVSTKILAWPIVVMVALQRRGRAVAAATLTILGAHALVLPFIGFSGLVDYYTRVGPLNALIWRPSEGNYSAWGWANRLFRGFGFGFGVSPLWPSLELGDALTPVLPGLMLALGLWLAKRAARFDTAFSMMIGVSLLVSPIFWNFYLLLAAIPIAVLCARLSTLGWPWGKTGIAVALLCVLFTYADKFERIARASGRDLGGGGILVPFGWGLVLLAPVGALIGLLFLVWSTDTVEESQHAPDGAGTLDTHHV